MVNLHGGADSICAIVTATSVFAPRVADDVPAGKCKQTAEKLFLVLEKIQQIFFKLIYLSL